jgi:protein-L-isoaspartate(D-aspartate) O-methyltransferase
MDFAVARRNMVECQLRTNRITQDAVIAAMGEVPRERFVPDNLANIAYVDEDLAVGGERYLVEPMVLGRLLQESRANLDDVALLVGCGTGYSAAVLSKLCSAVFALESDGTFAGNNAVVVEGPLDKGWPGEAPYNLIVFDGAVSELPSAILDQLADDGRLVAVVCDDQGVGRATLMEKRGGVVSSRTLFDANTPMLPGFAKSAGFVF